MRASRGMILLALLMGAVSCGDETTGGNLLIVTIESSTGVTPPDLRLRIWGRGPEGIWELINGQSNFPPEYFSLTELPYSVSMGPGQRYAGDIAFQAYSCLGPDAVLLCERKYGFTGGVNEEVMDVGVCLFEELMDDDLPFPPCGPGGGDDVLVAWDGGPLDEPDGPRGIDGPWHDVPGNEDLPGLDGSPGLDVPGPDGPLTLDLAEAGQDLPLLEPDWPGGDMLLRQDQGQSEDRPPSDMGPDSPPEPTCHPLQMAVDEYSPLFPGAALRVVATDDLLMVITQYDHGLFILRRDDMTLLKQHDEASLQGNPKDIFLFGDKVYLAVGSQPSRVVTMTIDPASGNILNQNVLWEDSEFTARRVFADDRGVYLLLHSFSQNLTHLRAMGDIAKDITILGCSSEALLVQGNLAFVTCGHYFLKLDLTRQDLPAELDPYSACSPSYCYKVNCSANALLDHGGYIYATYDFCNGGGALDVMDTIAMEETDTEWYSDDLWGLTRKNDHVFVASSNANVKVLNASDPADPISGRTLTLEREFEAVGKVPDVTVQGPWGYGLYNIQSPTADKGWGIARIDLACDP